VCDRHTAPSASSPDKDTLTPRCLPAPSLHQGQPLSKQRLVLLSYTVAYVSFSHPRVGTLTQGAAGKVECAYRPFCRDKPIFDTPSVCLSAFRPYPASQAIICLRQGDLADTLMPLPAVLRNPVLALLRALIQWIEEDVPAVTTPTSSVFELTLEEGLRCHACNHPAYVCPCKGQYHCRYHKKSTCPPAPPSAYRK
jgi:hypothetical protein